MAHRRDFFHHIGILVPLSTKTITLMKQTYKTKSAFYVDIDTGGPSNNSDWVREGQLTEKDLINIRSVAISMRQKPQCIIL